MWLTPAISGGARSIVKRASKGALRLPTAPGLKYTLNVVLAPAARLVGKVGWTRKSAACVPETTALIPVSVALPELRSVSALAVEVVPGSTEPKPSVALPDTSGLPPRSIEISGLACPVPASWMENAPSSASLLEITSVA